MEHGLLCPFHPPRKLETFKILEVCLIGSENFDCGEEVCIMGKGVILLRVGQGILGRMTNCLITV